MSDILCKGLAASSLLAHLASFGLLRTVSRLLPGTHMSWSWKGWWRPTLHVANNLDEEGLLDLLEAEFNLGKEHPHWPVGFELGGPVDDFRERIKVIASDTRLENREAADWWSSYGSETYEHVTEKKRGVEFSPWIYPHGQGGQHLLSMLRAVQHEDPKVQVNRQRLREALFSPWGYQTRAKSIPATRWDPIDTQNHATCAGNPSKDKFKPCMPGAVRLAAEALPLLVAVPTAEGISSPACVSTRKTRKRDDNEDAETGTEFGVVGLHFLPIWDGKLSINAARSLLSHPTLCSVSDTSRAELRQLGLLERLRYRCAKSGKYSRSTAPSSCL